jgi:hypothetical protein
MSSAEKDNSLEDRSLEQALLPLETETSDQFEPTSIAAHLWSVLSEMHTDMNSLARVNVHSILSETQIELVNGTLDQIIRLLAASGRAQNLRLLDHEKPITTGDALLILGHYKGSLRAYRIGVLNEGQFSF